MHLCYYIMVNSLHLYSAFFFFNLVVLQSSLYCFSFTHCYMFSLPCCLTAIYNNILLFTILYSFASSHAHAFSISPLSRLAWSAQLFCYVSFDKRDFWVNVGQNFLKSSIVGILLQAYSQPLIPHTPYSLLSKSLGPSQSLTCCFLVSLSLSHSFIHLHSFFFTINSLSLLPLVHSSACLYLYLFYCSLFLLLSLSNESSLTRQSSCKPQLSCLQPALLETI